MRILLERALPGCRAHVFAHLVAIEPAQRQLDGGATQSRNDVADARPLDFSVAKSPDDQCARGV